MYSGRLPGNRGIGEQASEDKAQMDMGRDISGMASGLARPVPRGICL